MGVIRLYEIRSKMRKIIEGKELNALTNELFWELVKDHSVDIHLYDSSCKQLCINDLLGLDITLMSFVTRTGIKIAKEDIDYIEII